MRRRREDHGRPPADLVLRLAVLLQAGLAPAAAWRHLARDDADAGAVVAALEADPRGELAAAIARRGPAWAPLTAAWAIAERSGAPLADTLRAIAAALRESDDCRDEVRIALAEPAATARLMSWLPLVAVGLGLLLGFDPLGTLLTNPVGIACGVAGVGLMVGARAWTGRLVRSARPAEGVPGLVPELLAIALTGGVSLDRARMLVAEAGADEADGETERLLVLSREAGVPAVELLRASAALARHRARVEGRLRAATLSSRLLLPLGVCVLPAFLALGVAPMLLSVLGTTELTL
ncbi:type II secretion system F family protein [Microbacterium sp. GXF7504]